jgi:hypothetical protein
VIYSATVASIYKFAIHIRDGEKPGMAAPECKSLPSHDPDAQQFTDNPPGYGYQLSRIIPVQFGKYGTTFWIPSTVEPSIALNGMSLPALRQLYFKLRGRDVPGTTAVSARSKNLSGMTGGSSHKNTLTSCSESGHAAGRFYHLDDSEIELRGTSDSSSKNRNEPPFGP